MTNEMAQRLTREDGPGPHARRPRGVAVLRVLAVVAALAAVPLTAFGVGDGVLRDLYAVVPAWLAAALLVSRAVLVPRERAAWSVLALGVVLFAAAYSSWSLDLRHRATVPYPSLADVGLMAFYVCSYVGIGLLVRARVVRFGATLWLDGVIGALAVAAIGSAVLLDTLAGSGKLSLAGVVTNLLFPMADLVVLAVFAAVLAFVGWRPGRVWLTLAAGFAVIAVADVAYLIQLTEGTYHLGSVVGCIWPAGLVVLGLAAWQPQVRRSAGVMESWRSLAVPSALSLAALAVLVGAAFRPVPAAAVVLAGAAILAVVARASLTLRELRSLTESRRLALTDELTGLGNRRSFYQRLRSTLEAAERVGTGDGTGTGAGAALLLVDVDRFKELNDALGHQSGDAVLVQLAERLERAVPSHATVARLGGDEFAVVLPGGRRGTAEAVALDVARVFERPFEVDELSLRVDASTGIAIFPEHAGSAEELLRRADVALDQAKAQEGPHAIYASARDPHSRDRLSLLQELRRGIDRGELVVHYQPKVDVASGRVVGVEALVRWQHAERGLIPPGEFLPLVERSGLVRTLTRAVCELAVAQIACWRASGCDISLAVNVAAPDLLDTGFVDELLLLLTRHGLEPSNVVLEITEGSVLDEDGGGHETLRRLRAAGFELSLDDFGQGHSSLSRLHALPLHELKVDRAFVDRMLHDPSAEVIVRSVIDLAGTLGLRTVAEGVEDEDTVAALRALGCGLLQGFHLGRPVPAGELTPRLLAESLRPRSAVS